MTFPANGACLTEPGMGLGFQNEHGGSLGALYKGSLTEG